ncbi:hypothetical protein AB0F72_08290 [Actinoplanes sp. NPDC023936]|uniref:hypothetical protein n=1 Tax=Actinoplanes sp. NPDC023936 TaxID=3154910 RepID=UPI0033C8185E
MVNAVAYLYPWDVLGDPRAVDRVAALGVNRVALGASYHAVRAATPLHPRHRIVHATHGALYLPVPERRWATAAIRPRTAAAWTGRDDSFAAARDLLRARGLEVDAWVVLTHTDPVTPTGFAPRNAFGDTYGYGLCPAFREVRDYARTLVEEVMRAGAPDGLIVEACGPMGAGHQSEHEKTAGADWDALDERLLSICFCAACTDLMADPGGARSAVTAAVGTGRFVPDEVAADVLAVRSTVTAALRDEVVFAARAAGAAGAARAAGAAGRLGFFADADPWAVGPAAHVREKGDFYIASAWDASISRVAALRASVTGRVAAYVTILPPTVPDSDRLTRDWQGLIDAGADELHVYHAGLASAARLDAAARALRNLKEGNP